MGVLKINTPRHYQIRKYVFCDIIDGACTDEQNVTVRLTPNCKECKEYINWKESKLNILEYSDKQTNDYLDKSMPGWRDDK